jgi:hypothetical protein
MKKIKIFLSAFAFLITLAGCVSHRATTKTKKQPCGHVPLDYSPVLIKINLSASYKTKGDYQTFQREDQQELWETLNIYHPRKYQLAEDARPNLTINIALNTDGYEHYGATVDLYVSDGSVRFQVQTNYSDFEKLYNEVVQKLDGFVVRGWFIPGCK